MYLECLVSIQDAFRRVIKNRVSLQTGVVDLSDFPGCGRGTISGLLKLHSGCQLVNHSTKRASLVEYEEEMDIVSRGCQR